MSRKKRVVRNKLIKTKSEKESEFYLRIFYVIIISNIVFWTFFEPKTFGYDVKYYIFVLWIPIIIGIILTSRLSLVKEMWHDLYTETTEKIHKKILVSLFILLCLLLFSYLTFGFIANVT